MSFYKQSSDKLTCRDIDGNPIDFKCSDYSFRPSVYGLIFQDEEVLLGQHSDGKYDIPGGGVEIHESLDEALEREVFEETGLKAKKHSVIDATQSFFYLPGVGKPVSAILIFCLCFCDDFSALGNANMDDWEKEQGIEPVWVRVKGLTDEDFKSNVPTADIVKKGLEMYKQK